HARVVGEQQPLGRQIAADRQQPLVVRVVRIGEREGAAWAEEGQAAVATHRRRIADLTGSVSPCSYRAQVSKPRRRRAACWCGRRALLAPSAKKRRAFGRW